MFGPKKMDPIQSEGFMVPNLIMYPMFDICLHDAKWKVLWISILHICSLDFLHLSGKKNTPLDICSTSKSLKNCTCEVPSLHVF